MKFYCMHMSTATFLGALAIGATPLLTASAQMEGMGGATSRRAHVDVGAQAIGVVTRESPAVAGRTLTEGYLTQPAVMLHAGAFGDAITLKATLNFEGATIKRGELNAGIYGEGYVDRRHPHTYLHELIATGKGSLGGISASIAAGKGFAPFGTDDPMSRPFEKYPVNHHLSQILERVVAIGAVRAGNVVVEGGLFNGDEPEGAGDVPNRRRYWDSWGGRLTFAPYPQIEMQTSYARVKSPENARGGGPDQRKSSASIRLEDAQHTGYALAEWSRASDYVGKDRSFFFSSYLLETAASYKPFRGALRWERTERPDEERLIDLFRTAVPATDFSISGRSRWTTESARLSVPVVVRRGGLEPFVEVARVRFSPTVTPTGFDPRTFYGSDHIWSFSAGVKLSFGMQHMRMGRYGVAELDPWGMKPGNGTMHENMDMGAITGTHQNQRSQ